MTLVASIGVNVFLWGVYLYLGHVGRKVRGQADRLSELEEKVKKMEKNS